MTRERRWVVIGEDGRHATLGWHTDPSEEEINAAEAGLVALRTGGWLAVTEGGLILAGRDDRPSGADARDTCGHVGGRQFAFPVAAGRGGRCSGSDTLSQWM